MMNRYAITTEGHIEKGPFEGLYLRPLLEAMRVSAWDWPSAMGALGLVTKNEVSAVTMYPGDDGEAFDFESLRNRFPEEDWNDFQTFWDT